MQDKNELAFRCTKQGFIKGISFLSALLLVLGAGAGANYARAQQYQTLLEDSYSGSLSGLSSNLSGIAAALQKGRYAASSTQVSYLAATLWKEASAAKTALGNLPVGELHLDHTNQFLSQVGDYAMSLSRKSVSGGEITQKEREQFERLYQYGLSLASQVSALEQELRQNAITMESIKNEITQMNTAGAQPQGTQAEAGNTGGFLALEEAFSGYPPLIYDGPFSTHITYRSPALVDLTKEIPRETALQNAARAAGVQPGALQMGSDENGRLPCYTFSGEELWVGVTKSSGHVVYLMKSRLPASQEIEPAVAITRSQQYLSSLGFPDMTPTYYELSNNVCTVSLAASQGDVVLYPDLVKVEIAMDNGEVLGLDTRGYLYNHKARDLVKPTLTAESAANYVSDALTVQRTRLAVIPTQGQNEVFCWELSAVSDDGERVLAYINANTGVEEQLLLLAQNGLASALL